MHTVRASVHAVYHHMLFCTHEYKVFFSVPSIIKITSAIQGGRRVRCHPCLFVYFSACEQDISNSCVQIRTKLGGQVEGCVTRTNLFDFGEGPNPDPDPRII